MNPVTKISFNILVSLNKMKSLTIGSKSQPKKSYTDKVVFAAF